MERPEVEGLTWLGSTLVEVVVPFFDKYSEDLNLPREVFYNSEIIDLKKLSCVRDYYPDTNDEKTYSENELDEDGRSIYESLVDIEGVATHCIRVSKEDLLKVWLYVKSLE